jgi:SAM-dependent methyltransferase
MRNHSPSIQVFEELAQEYDAWFEKYPLVYQSELLALRKLLPATPRSLEIGVGTGRFAAPLGIALGVEPARAMAAIAGKRGVHVCVALAESLPFADRAFAVVLMVTVICFLPDPVRALGEALRILEPGRAHNHRHD